MAASTGTQGLETSPRLFTPSLGSSCDVPVPLSWLGKLLLCSMDNNYFVRIIMAGTEIMTCVFGKIQSNWIKHPLPHSTSVCTEIQAWLVSLAVKHR